MAINPRSDERPAKGLLSMYSPSGVGIVWERSLIVSPVPRAGPQGHRPPLRFGCAVSPQVCNDRPAIGYNDVWPVGHHGVFAIRNGIENLAIRHLTDSFILKGNDSRESVLLCDPVTCCGSAVTHRASDVETLLPSLHQVARDRNRNTCSPVIAHFAGIVVIGTGTKIRAGMGPGTHVDPWLLS